MDSFAAAYILNHKNDAWYNLRGGRQAYAQGDLEVILWTGSYAHPKRLRWEASFKGEPITLKHPKRIWQALARNAQENYFPPFPDKYKEITEKLRIQDLKKILKIKD